MTSGRFLCVRLPNWPIQRLVVARLELRRRVVVLTRRDPRRGEIVAACCAGAANRGVRVGMPAVEAGVLMVADSGQGTPLFETHEPAVDLAALVLLAERCGRFSPWVGWDTLGGRGEADWCGSKFAGLTLIEGPSVLILDIHGIAGHFGGEAALVNEVRKEFIAAGYEVVIGVADTIGAAWALALECGDSSPLLESWEMPVESLRLADETVELLHRLGIQTIAELLRLPRQELPARFGPLLVRRIDQALGNVPEWVVPHHPQPRLEVERLLDYPLDRRDILEEILQQMLSKLGALLQQRDVGAMQLECRLAGEGKSLRLEVGLYRPSASAKRMWELFRLPWERTPLVGPIDRLQIRVLQTARLQAEQGELFADLHDANEPRDLIERLAGRLGKDAVGRPILRQEVVPERSYQVRALTGGVFLRPKNSSGKRRKTSAVKPTSVEEHPRRSLPLERPLQLFASPRMIRVQTDEQGRPASLGEEEIARHWGPERLETGWWRGRSVRRDYYRVETAAGRRYWIFVNRITGEWFWQGSF